MQIQDGAEYSRQEAPRPDHYEWWCKTKKRGSLKLLPADGIIIAHSPSGGIGTLRCKSNCRGRYARNIGPPIGLKCGSPRQDRAHPFHAVLLTPQKNGKGPCTMPVTFLRQA